MAAKLYARLALMIDGVFQIEATNVSIEFNPSLQAVDTLEGRSGYTQGAGFATISAGAAVPIGGLEFDFMSAMAKNEPHDLEVVVGGKSYAGSGFFQSGSVGQSAGANTESSWTWEGQLKPLE